MIKARFKVFIALIFCFSLLITFQCGCTFKYRGKNSDLYTVAINCLLWNNGHSMGAEHAIQPKIEILETDDFGRTLFTYYERAGAEYNLIISQSCLDGYVYYYEDSNFLTKEFDKNTAEFSKEEKDNLKLINDWGKEVELEKCVKKEITNVKKSIPCDKKLIEEQVVKKFNTDGKNYWTNLKYLTSDSLGNFIVYGYLGLSDKNITHTHFAIFINSDFEYFDFFEPSDLYYYQNEFKAFKEKNGWVS